MELLRAAQRIRFPGAEALLEAVSTLTGSPLAVVVWACLVAGFLLARRWLEAAALMSFPVAGTLMIEPTESEDLGELDRFCDAMIAIRAEIEKVASGEWPADDNPLRNAPHTAAALGGAWEHAYTRAEAVFPAGVSPADKYWPPVRRIDQAFGDRNLVCSCPPPEAFA